MLELNRLYNMDCMEGMKDFPDKYFDLAIVDPPYGINFDGNTTVKGKSWKSNTFNNKQHHKIKGWDIERPNYKYFFELQRISQNQIIWGGNYFSDLLKPKKGWIFWDKKITNLNNKNFSDGELAWTSFNCILRRFTYDWIGFGYLNNPNNENKIHPTQKPIALYKWLLKNYAKPEYKIIDTHAGSCSSVIAFLEFGCQWIAFEIDKDYYQAASKRIENYKAQLKIEWNA